MYVVYVVDVVDVYNWIFMVLGNKERKKKVAIEIFYKMNDSGLHYCLKPFSGLLRLWRIISLP